MSKADKALAASGKSGRYTFPKERRITRKPAYDAVFRGGQKRVSPLLVCYLLPKREGESRLGMAVSRKVGRAVTRNRVKRRLRETFRLLRPELPEPLDIVVVARPACARVSGSELADDFRAILRKWHETRGKPLGCKR